MTQHSTICGVLLAVLCVTPQIVSAADACGSYPNRCLTERCTSLRGACWPGMCNPYARGTGCFTCPSRSTSNYRPQCNSCRPGFSDGCAATTPIRCCPTQQLPATPQKTLRPPSESDPELVGPQIEVRSRASPLQSESVPEPVELVPNTAPSLRVLVTGPETQQVETAATFGVVIQNTGDNPIEDVELECAFDEGLVFPGSTESLVRKKIGRLGPKESRQEDLSLLGTLAGQRCGRFAVLADGVKVSEQQVCINFVQQQGLRRQDATGTSQASEGRQSPELRQGVRQRGAAGTASVAQPLVATRVLPQQPLPAQVRRQPSAPPVPSRSATAAASTRSMVRPKVSLRPTPPTLRPNSVVKANVNHGWQAVPTPRTGIVSKTSSRASVAVDNIDWIPVPNTHRQGDDR